MVQYLYLLWALAFLLIWLFLFIYRKDTRHEMLSISCLFGLGGLASEKAYVHDWWQPLTITNTMIGIEDFIIGFAIGGVAAIIYEELFHKKFRKQTLKTVPPANPGFFLFFFPFLFLILFFLLDVNSFYATVIPLSLCTLYMWATRADLIPDSVLSGVFMAIIGIGMYMLLLLIYPAFIQEFWYLPNHWYTYPLFGIPIGEYIWYFLIGAYIGPLYEYLRRLKLIPLGTSHKSR